MAPIERSRQPKIGVPVTERWNVSAARARLWRIQLRNVASASVLRRGWDESWLGEVPQVGRRVVEVASPVIDKFEVSPVYPA